MILVLLAAITLATIGLALTCRPYGPLARAGVRIYLAAGTVALWAVFLLFYL